MDAAEYRFAVTADKYLEKHNVLVYIEDAIMQLLEHKDDNSKVNSTKFMSEYFVSVREGNHTLFREYAFIKATPHNRACFVKTFWKCYRNIGRKGDLLSAKEYHSLLCLLCSDFPFTPVQKTAKIILMEDALDSLISFSDFLFAFQIQLCFDEFLTRCAELYKELLTTKQTSHDPVVVPTSEEATPRVQEDETSTRPDGVDALSFSRSLTAECDKFSNLAPPLPILRDILSGAERVTFYGFLLALAKNERLNAAIGKLPGRGELLDTTDQELSHPSLRPSSAKPRPGSAVSTQHTATGSAPSSAGSASHVNQLPPANSSTVSLGTKPVSHVKPARLQKKLLRKQASSESDDDDTDDSSDTN